MSANVISASSTCVTQDNTAVTDNLKQEMKKNASRKYTVSQKNDTDVRFNPHQPISVIFGRDVAERVCY